MSEDVDLDERLKLSARKLRAWNWMAAISTNQVEAVGILRDEARLLIQFGLQHPDQIGRIGRLIVAYRTLIDAIEHRIEERELVEA